MSKLSMNEQITTLSARSVELYSKEELEIKLKEDRPLRIKLGADPSAPDIHLGHVVVLNKLREFQECGHTVVFIIGDFTGMIGDPSGRSQTRKPLTQEEIKLNALTYQEQVFSLLDPKRTEVRFNSEWCAKLAFEEVLQLTSHCTVAQLLARDDFAQRFKANQPISLMEFMYPLVQGYDSVMVQADVEIGGTDQVFNLLVGRELQKAFGQKPQVVMTFPLLEGLDGTNKMSKSLGNYVGVTEEPREVFGKIMSINDDLMWRYYSLVLGMNDQNISVMKEAVNAGEKHPKDIKDELAQQIIAKFHNKEMAKSVSQEFSRIYSRGQLPDEIPTVSISSSAISEGQMNIVSLLQEAKLVMSKSEARRLVEQGGVRVDDQKIIDPKQAVTLCDDLILKAGKRKYAQLKIIS